MDTEFKFRVVVFDFVSKFERVLIVRRRVRPYVGGWPFPKAGSSMGTSGASEQAMGGAPEVTSETIRDQEPELAELLLEASPIPTRGTGTG